MPSGARHVAALLAALVLPALPGLPGLPSTAPGKPADPVAAPPAAASPAPVAAPTVAAAALLPGRVFVGIGDQKPEMFTDRRFVALGVRHARLAVGWDAMTSGWQVQQLDEWLDAARAAGVQPLISFGHSRTHHRSLPSPVRMRAEFRHFRTRYPWVTTFAIWNEANLCGEPVCHRPKLVASYYRALRHECPTCTIVAPEVLDMPNAVAWVRDFRRELGYTPKIWGVHNYVEANRFRMTRLRNLIRALPGADFWLTETGGLVRRENASTTSIPQGVRHAADVTRYLFDRVLPLNPRIKAIFIYHWNAGPADVSWDSALIAPAGGARRALSVLRRVLRAGPRPHTSFRSPAG